MSRVGQIEDQPASAAGAPRNSDLLRAGTTAPGFSLKTPQGETVRLPDYRGKAMLLELFATWCPHCQAEAPHLKALAQSMDKSRFAFVSINGDSEDAASLFAYHRYFGLPFPALLDPGSPAGSFHQAGGAGPVSQAYHLGKLPDLLRARPEGTHLLGDGRRAARCTDSREAPGLRACGLARSYPGSASLSGS